MWAGGRKCPKSPYLVILNEMNHPADLEGKAGGTLRSNSRVVLLGLAIPLAEAYEGGMLTDGGKTPPGMQRLVG
jgi:hypothetical protein